MPWFSIIEVDEGLTVMEVSPHTSAEEAAASRGARLVDGGPYRSYEDAVDAMMEISDEETQA